MRSAVLLSFVAISIAACGGPNEQTGGPATPQNTATASAAPSAAATTSAAASASAGADVRAPSKPAKPQMRFWGFDGPAEGPAITGKRAWTAIPTGKADDPYRHVFISVEDFVKADAANNHFSAPYGDIVAPLAMATNLAAPAALKKGDPIIAENSNDSAMARVTSVEGTTVKMKYVFGDLVGDFEAPLAEVLLLDGSMRLGTPVAFKLDSKWYVGRLLAKSAQDAWVALHYTDNQPYAKPKVADVRALDVAKVWKVGDACWADSSYITKNELVPAKVTKVIEDGLFYEVKTDKGATWTVPFHHVSAPQK